MWDHYKKTFKPVQAAIAIATVGVYFGLHRLWMVTAVFFLMMQAGSLVGALWAQRLRRKLQPQVW
ncbi:MAG TPA: hypothetical protein VHG72_19300 [Polyangia bacterium]|nr:hypothetical protein [Polyangia bacterium]